MAYLGLKDLYFQVTIHQVLGSYFHFVLDRILYQVKAVCVDCQLLHECLSNVHFGVCLGSLRSYLSSPLHRQLAGDGSDSVADFTTGIFSSNYVMV